ncbi:MAG: hypothetical protein K2G22_01170 [Eubacterium sp.]|nr:hypothetical protein [Eubacterium sp.]
MLDENWVNFTQTGNINDYLKYKQNEKLKAENNAKNNQGFSDKGTDYRGE